MRITLGFFECSTDGRKVYSKALMVGVDSFDFNASVTFPPFRFQDKYLVPVEGVVAVAYFIAHGAPLLYLLLARIHLRYKDDLNERHADLARRADEARLRLQGSRLRCKVEMSSWGVSPDEAHAHLRDPANWPCRREEVEELMPLVADLAKPNDGPDFRPLEVLPEDFYALGG